MNTFVAPPPLRCYELATALDSQSNPSSDLEVQGENRVEICQKEEKGVKGSKMRTLFQLTLRVQQSIAKLVTAILDLWKSSYITTTFKVSNRPFERKRGLDLLTINPSVPRHCEVLESKHDFR
jgi:hypothetical protein